MTFDCIQRSFPDKCLILPTPCLEISCLAAELSVNWWCSTSPDKKLQTASNENAIATSTNHTMQLAFS